jgi:hypothetical protein
VLISIVCVIVLALVPYWMMYPARLVRALPLVFSVGAVHDSVTLSAPEDVVAPEELEPPAAPLDELPEEELPEEVELLAAPLDEPPELDAEADKPPEDDELRMAPLDELPEVDPEAKGLPEEVEPLAAPLDELLELDAEAKGLPEEVGLLVAPLDEPLELEVEATTGAGALGLLPTLVAAPLPVLTGGVTATLLLASLTEPALSVEPPHPARATEMADAPRMWARSPRRFLIFIRSPR